MKKSKVVPKRILSLAEMLACLDHMGSTKDAYLMRPNQFGFLEIPRELVHACVKELETATLLVRADIGTYTPTQKFFYHMLRDSSRAVEYEADLAKDDTIRSST